MKRLLGLTLLSLLSVCAFAQSAKSEAASLRERMNAFDCVRITFHFMARDASHKHLADQQGSFIAQGDMFRMETGDVRVYCDGAAKYIYDKANDEMTITPHDAYSNDISENPFSVLRNMNEKAFSFSKNADGHLLLKPLEKKANYVSIEIVVDLQTHLPKSLKYVSRTGDYYIADITSLKESSENSASFYAPESAIMDSAIITDMR